MPRYSTSPTLYDEVLQINLSKLKQWGYLNPEQLKSGALNWSINGEEIASISITVNTNYRPYIELSYNSDGDPRKYKIWLTTVPSNLGIGEIWYFICPQTHRRCRKLYLVSGYFFHRDAFSGCMYDCQTKSKSWRQIDKVYGSLFKLDELYEELNSKHFKTHYNGKPTRRYLKLMEKIRRIELLNF
jgi:hypothetical protein